ncbi:hypothetical protein H9P43_003293 [Blastocladiella emersonii ATCC 22665]|nr:hypothetical protein H9P43_003293 [Blastocladiella emersonii ATCC 22665]
MSPLAAYREFLLHNAAQISSVESALRSLSYFLPGRFADADLASEALYAVVNLVSLYHDRVLYDAVRGAGIDHKPALVNQYHRYWHAASPAVHYASTALTLVQTVESVCEMAAAKRWSERRRWDVVAGIEALKAALRLIIVARTQRLTLTPASPERDLDPAQVGAALEHAAQDRAAASDPRAAAFKGPRTGVVLPPAAAMGSASAAPLWERYLAAKAVRNAFRSPADLLSVLRGSRAAGEVLFVLRPLLYVVLLRKYGRQSWIPVAVSVVAEVLAYLLVAGKEGGVAAKGKEMTGLERGEVERRKYLFLFYLLRGPVYDQFTKHALDSFCSSLENKPLLRLFAGIVRDYQPLWEHVYMYTSGS